MITTVRPLASFLTVTLFSKDARSIFWALAAALFIRREIRKTRGKTVALSMRIRKIALWEDAGLDWKSWLEESPSSRVIAVIAEIGKP